MDMKAVFTGLAAGQRPNADTFSEVFAHMISGDMPEAQITAFLLGLEQIGITSAELTIGANVLRNVMSKISAPEGAIDIVGTGGDGLSTYNISTACVFVTAGAGVPVAKHGNRAVSSKSGASDVLSALGVKLDIDTARTEACLAKTGAAFLFAPNHHSAMRHVGPARAALGIKTLFNRLGPLCNPASVEHILLGVSDDELRGLYGETIKALGAKRALIVHGSDGMDEITTTGPTYVSDLKDGRITAYEIAPQDFGIKLASLSDLEGGDEDYNAKALTSVLEDKSSAYADIVILNSGAAIYVAGKAVSIAQGIEIARKSISSGAAKAALQNLIKVSNG